MDMLFKVPLFPISWLMEYIPSFFRFIVAACVLFKMFKDVHNYNRTTKPGGVLRHPQEMPPSCQMSKSVFNNAPSECFEQQPFVCGREMWEIR
ncbi:hypothetical protein JTB14_025888 [Gonioctena quinquepunctata]|nr:hypothetical protein JTB14_025888 [Gonioctena quinquepunctata]